MEIKISEYEYKIEKQGKMKVPVKIFASEKLLEAIKQDKTLLQASNMATLPGVIENIIVCPDAHEGYGACIGGVSAFNIETGVVSPGEIGYDINCSIRVLTTNLNEKDIIGKEKQISQKIFNSIPSGVGKKGNITLSETQLNEILKNGAQWAVENNYGNKEDYINTEDSGKIENANPEYVSERAKTRGKKQLGTLGAGNHFLELQKVEEIFDEETAKIFNLKKGMIVIMIHCGSRGLGHQVASDYIQLMEKKYGWPEQDRELVNAPINSELGKKYLSAMACSANFGFANKQVITHFVRESMKKIFPEFKAEVLYDVCHNIAKFETHKIDNQEKEILVVRKGATRAFGPGRNELPKKYQQTGQPIILPGSMGTSSYILAGTKKAEEISFASTAHGAGRIMSRHKAINTLNSEKIKKQLIEKNIRLTTENKKSILEESPEAYKDIDEVVKVSNESGIGKKIAKLIPLIVIKG